MINIGKAFVPQEVLTKTTPLTEDNRRLIHEGLAKSAKLLKRMSFDMEVGLTLEQTREKWDGSGLPNGLADDEILLPARIISVANTFVEMLSDRAYRSGMDIPEATQEMVALAGKNFDRRVVMALNHYLENKGGRDVLDLLRQDAAEPLDVHLDAFFAAA
jgi:HD-GYP domain-containing protein (c-di-GMP phosphodiesterase class II)